ncbi:tRNA (adenine22-N1)-methyltransferase [Streptococcus moroccensis]|uniref:tRNA (Adenine22-N1)-methyltransferase n=2 Tax=Streptococcus moroccensis TaxID=1451356 RepID=A0ABT9YRS4_9STRE|nr:tRNA (adenine22-N1)-methyltransferase [Streptococcus moroccensis]
MEIVSERLKKIASFVPTGTRLLDVGSDHAYLPLYLMAQDQISFAIAGEVVDGPYQSARRHVADSAYHHAIDVRLADGLSAMTEEDNIQTVVIAGMGGRLIARILEDGQNNLESVERLILQPNNSEDEVRAWLNSHGYALVAEQILSENGKVYEILVAEPGEQTLSDLELRFGPFLLQEKSDIFRARWRKEDEKLSQILANIPPEKSGERQFIIKQIDAIKEVLT